MPWDASEVYPALGYQGRYGHLFLDPERWTFESELRLGHHGYEKAQKLVRLRDIRRRAAERVIAFGKAWQEVCKSERLDYLITLNQWRDKNRVHFESMMQYLYGLQTVNNLLVGPSLAKVVEPGMRGIGSESTFRRSRNRLRRSTTQHISLCDNVATSSTCTRW